MIKRAGIDVGNTIIYLALSEHYCERAESLSEIDLCDKELVYRIVILPLAKPVQTYCRGTLLDGQYRVRQSKADSYPV